MEDWRVPACSSTIIKAILRVRDVIQDTQEWNTQITTPKFSTRAIYKFLRGNSSRVEWCDLIIRNYARPKAVFILWLAMHGRLATKDRLAFFGIHTDSNCSFCDGTESIKHLFFQCPITYRIFQGGLTWLRLSHPHITNWQHMITWFRRMSKGNGGKATVFRVFLAETFYHIWQARNEKIFQNRELDTHATIRAIEYTTTLRCSNRRAAAVISLLA